MSGLTLSPHDRLLQLRVVGYLPAMRCRVAMSDDLRAGVAQASREETAASATGGGERQCGYGDWVGGGADAAAWCDGWSSPLTMEGMSEDVRPAS